MLPAHAREAGAARVESARRAVGAGGDQADMAMGFTTAAMPGADHHQAGILPGCSGVGLERDGFKSCDFLQGLFQFIDQLVIPFSLIDRYEGRNGG